MTHAQRRHSQQSLAVGAEAIPATGARDPQVHPGPSREELEKVVQRAFRAVEDLRFEDGMESPFSREIVALVRSHGEDALMPIAQRILATKGNSEVAAEALRWLGAMDDAPSHGSRRRLLERCLTSPSLAMRDGAALGLAAMDDAEAAPRLREALEREPSAEMRGLLQQVLAQLEE